MALSIPASGDTVTTVLGERVFADTVTMEKGLAVTGGITGSVFVAAPTAADDPGTTGQIAYDATHFYVCIDTDTWVRGDLATW